MQSDKAADTDAFVADASVGMAWSIVSQATPATEQLLERVAKGTPFLVPVLWPFEVANALLTLLRRDRIRAEDFARARLELDGLTPLVDDEGPRLAWNEITGLAEKFGLTVYDATYLELATRRGLPLASRDSALNNAARLSGVRTLL